MRNPHENYLQKMMVPLNATVRQTKSHLTVDANDSNTIVVSGGGGKGEWCKRQHLQLLSIIQTYNNNNNNT